MNTRFIRKGLLIGCILLALLTGCATPALETTKPTSEPLPETVIEMGEVIYDGTECNVSVPTELPPGRYSIVLKNLSEEEVKLWTQRITEGKTYQDLLDLQNEPGEYVPKPDWVVSAIETGSARDKPDGGKVYTYKFVSEGEYFVGLWIYATTTAPMKRWFCAPFLVKEMPSD